ncbi:AAA domain-containing protein [Kushneria phyllosphaerae]|uniref:DNA helicase n=1 Tax=Kushneria phyllosphaerae TaxID=2100822 RepID=A0A2R8CHX2_9GAMM|nr:AAA domain-containing protein [Kushneria phyllosphaerae]SPJ32412.1 hypothetical protein KSP9073_00412 [Kushneria phyllosphaerae]
MTTSSPSSSEYAERILSFWHKVEFFESAELKDVEHGKGAIHYRSDGLLNAPGCLPWLDRQVIRRAGDKYRVKNAYRFKLYLGVFERSEIFRVAREAYSDDNEDWEERSRESGKTCSLTVMVREDGTLDRDSFEISTAPWVLGALQQGTLDDITMAAFETATGMFRERLTTILNVADNLKREHDLPPVLSTFEIIEMLKAMQGWTAFAPESDAPALVVQLLPGSWKNSTASDVKEALAWVAMDQLAERLEAPSDDVSNTPSEPAATDEPADIINEIAILNSFFIRDLERILRQLKYGTLAPGSPLTRYLQGGCDQYPDLLRPEGKKVLMEHLAPACMPAGRWPGEDKHSMSLMQQFAINTIDQELEETGLYSVNGPPGTGKTTMLRDLVARNVVKRAEVLVSLSASGAAFGEDVKVNINDQLKSIRTLVPELAGFEMVVVSSNNAAVENVTRELPQSKALGSAYQDLMYLKPVAQKLAAAHDKQSDGLHVKPLAPQQVCWGLIATSLGKKANRDCFGERVFFKPINKCEVHEGAEGYSTLIPALKQLAEGRDAERDFHIAQQAFNTASENVAQIQQDLKRLQGLQQLERNINTSRRRLDYQRRMTSRLALWESGIETRSVRLWPPGPFFRHRATLKRVRQKLRHAEQSVELGQQRLDDLQRRRNAERDECASLLETYADALLPDDTLDLEAAEIQRTSFGHCEALNQARGQLTARAFELHQAWLVAAYAGNNRLMETLNLLMTMINGGVRDREAARALWQMLFMIVPVVSSTFASVASQFRALTEGEIGWLFVDEAGQASPQQAVGALWRARRAVVVGDPLQIEPVFTVPAGLVEAMAKDAFDRDWYKWSPTVSSVQVVADRANPYGTKEISDEFWVGSPLRVHRRCDEPMFSIANRIAYNDKMLHGNDDLAAGPGDSRWFDVEGQTRGKHYVPDQALKVADMLNPHIRNKSEIPNVYIISPFKAVAQGLQTDLAKLLDANAFGGASELRKWLKARVGTVHTFQGKEEDSVILVLGLSSESPGAAEWASGKPNLLNVALTRAKKRVYVVGSTEIWGSKQYFSEACEKLPIQAVADHG